MEFMYNEDLYLLGGANLQNIKRIDCITHDIIMVTEYRLSRCAHWICVKAALQVIDHHSSGVFLPSIEKC